MTKHGQVGDETVKTSTQEPAYLSYFKFKNT